MPFSLGRRLCLSRLCSKSNALLRIHKYQTLDWSNTVQPGCHCVRRSSFWSYAGCYLQSDAVFCKSLNVSSDIKEGFMVGQGEVDLWITL